MKKRTLSAIILFAIFIPIIYFGGIVFKVVALLIGVAALMEYLNLDKKIPLGAKIISILSLTAIILSNFNQTNFIDFINIKLVAFICLIHFCTCLFYHKNKNYSINECLQSLCMTYFLGIAFSLFIVIRNIDILIFIYLFAISILTDTFSQTVGLLFGKHKATPISPKKTWEGYLGGTILGVAGGVVIYMLFINPNIDIVIITLVTTILSIFGQLGDLFFSQIKRFYNIKDFSNTIPGHGGILDRLDSIIFVMICFTFLITLL